jgi:hypothetical protein
MMAYHLDIYSGPSAGKHALGLALGVMLGSSEEGVNDGISLG